MELKAWQEATSTCGFGQHMPDAPEKREFQLSLPSRLLGADTDLYSKQEWCPATLKGTLLWTFDAL